MTPVDVTLAAVLEDEVARGRAPYRPAEVDQAEALVSAALLTTTAFRLRDRAGLEDALRLLVRATDALQRSDLEHAA